MLKLAYNILLVDDYEDFAQITAMLLRQYGCNVTVCNNGRDCISLARETGPDIILLDLEMPMLDGFSTCGIIRGQVWGQQIPIIALTGHEYSSLGARLDNAGFDGHDLPPANETAEN